MSHHLQVIRADGQLTSHVELSQVSVLPMFLPAPILHLGVVELGDLEDLPNIMPSTKLSGVTICIKWFK